MEPFVYNGIEITPFGHATVMVKGSKRVYFDPFILPKDPEKADIIFISHSHYDHCSPEHVAMISDANTHIFAPSDCLSKLQGKNLHPVSAGRSFSHEDILIKAVPAYNLEKPFHPRGAGVGFVVSFDNVSFYHAGDTDLIPEMSALKVDVAFLPIGGTYTMDVSEAAKAALAIGPKLVIPIHYDHIEGTSADPSELKALLSESSIKVKC